MSDCQELKKLEEQIKKLEKENEALRDKCEPKRYTIGIRSRGLSEPLIPLGPFSCMVLESNITEQYSLKTGEEKFHLIVSETEDIQGTISRSVDSNGDRILAISLPRQKLLGAEFTIERYHA